MFIFVQRMKADCKKMINKQHTPFSDYCNNNKRKKKGCCNFITHHSLSLFTYTFYLSISTIYFVTIHLCEYLSEAFSMTRVTLTYSHFIGFYIHGLYLVKIYKPVHAPDMLALYRAPPQKPSHCSTLPLTSCGCGQCHSGLQLYNHSH